MRFERSEAGALLHKPEPTQPAGAQLPGVLFRLGAYAGILPGRCTLQTQNHTPAHATPGGHATCGEISATGDRHLQAIPA